MQQLLFHFGNEILAFSTSLEPRKLAKCCGGGCLREGSGNEDIS